MNQSMRPTPEQTKLIERAKEVGFGDPHFCTISHQHFIAGQVFATLPGVPVTNFINFMQIDAALVERFANIKSDK